MSPASHGVIKNRAPEINLTPSSNEKNIKLFQAISVVFMSIWFSQLEFQWTFYEPEEGGCWNQIVVRKGIFVVGVQGFFLHLITCRYKSFVRYVTLIGMWRHVTSIVFTQRKTIRVDSCVFVVLLSKPREKRDERSVAQTIVRQGIFMAIYRWIYEARYQSTNKLLQKSRFLSVDTFMCGNWSSSYT